jgi:hypothetical protein
VSQWKENETDSDESEDSVFTDSESEESESNDQSQESDEDKTGNDDEFRPNIKSLQGTPKSPRTQFTRARQSTRTTKSARILG